VHSGGNTVSNGSDYSFGTDGTATQTVN
jgi:hypothetical protein